VHVARSSDRATLVSGLRDALFCSAAEGSPCLPSNDAGGIPAAILFSRASKLLYIQRNIPLDKVRVSSFSSNAL